MSLLVAALTPLAIVFVIVTILLLLEPAPRRFEATPHRSKAKQFSILSIEQAFDPDHAIIWDTQLPVLELIASAGLAGLSLEALRPFYSRSARRYPELYDGSSFESWMDFLEDTELISVHRGAVSLTREGQQFLQYRVTPQALVSASQTRLADRK